MVFFDLQIHGSKELKDDAGNPSLLNNVPTIQFFHPYLTCFGLVTFLDETLTLLSTILAKAL